MQISIQTFNKTSVAVLEESGIIMNELEDTIDLLGNAYYMGAENILLKKEQISSDFFDLKTGFAGEVLQKFSNYRMKLAIVGDFSGFTSKSLRDFIKESNRNGHINFVSTRDEAMKVLNK